MDFMRLLGVHNIYIRLYANIGNSFVYKIIQFQMIADAQPILWTYVDTSVVFYCTTYKK